MKKLLIFVLIFAMMLSLIACDDESRQRKLEKELKQAQPTPTDISYSLERYNLIKRAYWVNGQREKANTLVCEIEKPLGYIILISNGVIIGKFVVDGKISSLNSFLTRVESADGYELADVDGSYGENDDGIFFFTTDGKYVEWHGEYLYTDIPFELQTPTVVIETKEG